MEIQSITPELEEKGLRLDKVILNHMPDVHVLRFRNGLKQDRLSLMIMLKKPTIR